MTEAVYTYRVSVKEPHDQDAINVFVTRHEPATGRNWNLTPFGGPGDPGMWDWREYQRFDFLVPTVAISPAPSLKQTQGDRVIELLKELNGLIGPAQQRRGAVWPA